ncbi:ABC transporter [Alicyclobacillus cellulosilyticus]|uniref:ABC transporter n=2 Tax=Alicyclobacillus cellulosilyticus TaxID=1003997 RepID=A0A917NN94_9BACL|nr:ABC transporter [Alicyclobacillus cellulosilyticus]
MSMLCGLYRPDAGEIFVHGEPVRFKSPLDALRRSIGMVHQSFRLVPTFTPIENVLLGHPSSPFWHSRSLRRTKREEIQAFANRYGLDLPPEKPMWQLSVGEQQRVEIIKTLYRGADIIILDEPTSVLSPGEVDVLLETLRRMANGGKTVILTTHKLREVMAVADDISVMRKGRMVKTLPARKANERELVNLMVGREVVAHIAKTSALANECIVEVHDLWAHDDNGVPALRGVNLRVMAGEIVGLAGVAGNGQKELAEVLTGMRSWTAGNIRMMGRRMQRALARDFIALGVCHVPENRLQTGLVGTLGLVDNLLLKNYRSPAHSRWGVLRTRENRAWASGLIRKYNVKTPALDTPVRQLSGGNQQKLLLARELEQNPKFMVAVHPTQGLDVAATEEVYQMLLLLRQQGCGILLISEDLDEVLRLSDRVLVMFGGSIQGEFSGHEVNREQVGRLMVGAPAEGEATG